MKNHSGFTLIELVMVIVILGILAAVALPKFIDLKTNASTSAVSGVAGSLGALPRLTKPLASSRQVMAFLFLIANRLAVPWILFHQVIPSLQALRPQAV